MQIGIPKEIYPNEHRVAATPETVKKLIQAGHRVVLQRGAGLEAAYQDVEYQQVGASMVDNAYAESQIILKIRAPLREEIDLLAPNSTVIALFDPYRNPNLADFAARQISSVALEMLPRTLSRAQNMDVLSSQANLAGYKAVLLAANAYQRLFPMLMTAAGTVKPARVVVMGVGVAGLQAIATAKRLGAIVEATDLRPTAKEQVQSLGAKWLEVPMSADEQQRADLAAQNGYGWTPAEQYIQDQARIVDQTVSQADVVICTALLPGRQAPRLINASTVAKMKAGSVIVDMAVEAGGNVEGSVFAETVITDNGVKILGPANIPALVASEASALFARNILHVLQSMLDDSQTLKLQMDDDIHRALLITHAGDVLLNRA